MTVEQSTLDTNNFTYSIDSSNTSYQSMAIKIIPLAQLTHCRMILQAVS